MKMFNNKKAIVTHPVMLFAVGIAVGLILAYFWINYTEIANPFCP